MYSITPLNCIHKNKALRPAQNIFGIEDVKSPGGNESSGGANQLHVIPGPVCSGDVGKCTVALHNAAAVGLAGETSVALIGHDIGALDLFNNAHVLRDTGVLAPMHEKDVSGLIPRGNPLAVLLGVVGVVQLAVLTGRGSPARSNTH